MKSERKETSRETLCATQMSLVGRLFLRGLVDRCFHEREREREREQRERERATFEKTRYCVFEALTYSL